MRGTIATIGLAAGLAVAGCAPEIGDSCSSATDCSVTGDRVCDLTQPGGYCSVQFCDPDSCPDGAVCVEWRFDPARTAETWCMKRCNNPGDCRSAYRCVDDEELVDEFGNPLARVVDVNKRPDVRFCAALEPGSGGMGDAGPGPDAQVLPMDAGPDGSPPDGSPPDGSPPDGSGSDGAVSDAAPEDGASADAPATDAS